jgi:hypothetical protein
LINLNFTCWSLIKKICQNTYWNKHLMLLEQQRDNEKTCLVKGWDVIPKQKCKMTKLHNKIIDKSTRFLDLAKYLYFAKHFRSFVVLRMFWWQYDWWHHL